MRKHHLKPLSICAIALLTMGAACDKPSGDKDGDGKGTSNVGDDIEVVDGKVRFYLSFAEDGTRKAMGQTFSVIFRVSVLFQVINNASGVSKKTRQQGLTWCLVTNNQKICFIVVIIFKIQGKFASRYNRIKHFVVSGIHFPKSVKNVAQ